MQGLHLTADLYGCTRECAVLTHAAALRALCLSEVDAAGLKAVGELFHPFESQGVTGVVLLAESHLAVHTWPELGAVTLDVYVCNHGADNSGAARQLLERLVAAFGPQCIERHELQRGQPRRDLQPP
jgi:S-adenosylmethionine decarboxylase